jgi:hypothetical protein
MLTFQAMVSLLILEQWSADRRPFIHGEHLHRAKRLSRDRLRRQRRCQIEERKCYCSAAKEAKKAPISLDDADITRAHFQIFEKPLSDELKAFIHVRSTKNLNIPKKSWPNKGKADGDDNLVKRAYGRPTRIANHI